MHGYIYKLLDAKPQLFSVFVAAITLSAMISTQGLCGKSLCYTFICVMLSSNENPNIRKYIRNLVNIDSVIHLN